MLSFGLEGKPPAADIEGEGAVVFPSKRTITLAFEEDVATLKLYGRMQDALILFNSVFLAMFWSVSQKWHENWVLTASFVCSAHFGSQMLSNGGSGGVSRVNIINLSGNLHGPNMARTPKVDFEPWILLNFAFVV